MRFAFAALLSVSTAFAQSPDVAKADVLFREGRAAMASGDFQEACPKLEESYRLDPAAGTAVNLGDCFDKQGKLGSALLAYRAARKLLKPDDKRIAPVDQQIADLEHRVPRLTISLAPDAPQGTTVERDGRAVDAADLGKPMPVNPGEITLVVSAPGHERFRKRLTLAERQTRTFVAEPGDPIGDAPRTSPYHPTRHDTRASSSDEPTSDGSTQRSLGYVLGGVGAASLAVGGIYWVLAQSVPEDCSNEAGCQTREEDEQSKLDTATGAAVLGVAGLAGGIALVLLAPEPAKASRVSIAPTVASTGYGLSLEGRW